MYIRIGKLYHSIICFWEFSLGKKQWEFSFGSEFNVLSNFGISFGNPYDVCYLWTRSGLHTMHLHTIHSTVHSIYGGFPFVYQFSYRIGVLVHSSFARISTTFQHRFKICLSWFLHEKECSFYTHLFCCTEMRWLFISSTAVWVTGSDTGSVASRAKTKLTSSKCDWTRIWTI